MREIENPRVLFIDDDLYAVQIFVEVLLDAGYAVSQASSPDEALDLAREERFDAVVIDIMMPPGSVFTAIETAGGYKTGIALARAIRELQPDTKLLALTSSTDPEVHEWFSSEGSAILRKPVPRREFLRSLRRLLHEDQPAPRMFVVHGHDMEILQELKILFRRRTGFPELVILADQPSRGLTLIEKFEKYAADADLALVLLTPDDVGQLADGSESPTQRARMNVLFELGYFLGALRRRTGRVFVLRKGNVAIPSDIAGLVYLDITAGVQAVEVDLERELAEWI